VAIAEAGRREIASLYGVESDRLSVVYNGVDLERFHPKNRAMYRGGVQARPNSAGVHRPLRG
jgi:hypothetical protein